MSLLAETSLSPTPTTAGGYEYIWFNGHPVAETNGGTHWTFTDHLGTPLIQTDSAGVVFWRAEYEPYGRVFALRTADQHQPLRLPGQEAEQLNLGTNGATERSYNIFRWYRTAWNRYTQSDPAGGFDSDRGLSRSVANAYGYARGNPLLQVDPTGEFSVDFDSSCRRLPSNQQEHLADAVESAIAKLPFAPPCAAKPLQRFTVHCGSCSGYCGHAGYAMFFGGKICLNVEAAFNGQCGSGPACLGATLFHEMMHACGGATLSRGKTERTAYGCQERFYGATGLCSDTTPGKYKPHCVPPCESESDR
jgi:RHS repeat-associated protein